MQDRAGAGRCSGALLLGDALSWPKFAAIVVATAGVVVMSWKPGELSAAGPTAPGRARHRRRRLLRAVGDRFSWRYPRPAGRSNFVLRATTTLAWGLAFSSVILVSYMAVANRAALRRSLENWKPSLAAGFLGAAASQFWFIGFSLTSAAANVRTAWSSAAGADRLAPDLRGGYVAARDPGNGDDRGRCRRAAGTLGRLDRRASVRTRSR